MEGSVIPEPYAYPAMPHQRRHGPSGWNDYHRYRPWLRDEFSFRCVYCLERELWRDMRVAMHIDHFEPQSLHAELGCVYTNLLYLCPNCNSLKRARALPDPCVTALGKCLRVHKDGRIEAINADGSSIIEVLALDQPTATRRRRMIIGVILSSAASDWKTFVEWMGYPPDLPNLSEPRNTPPSNSKPEGVAVSHYEKRLRGELPEIY
jgi:hypothetical protein